MLVWEESCHISHQQDVDMRRTLIFYLNYFCHKKVENTLLFVFDYRKKTESSYLLYEIRTVDSKHKVLEKDVNDL